MTDNYMTLQEAEDKLMRGIGLGAYIDWIAKMKKRFFFGQDNSSHWYIVPELQRRAWQEWTDIPEEDERSWEVPEYAERLDGGIGKVSFADPEGI